MTSSLLALVSKCEEVPTFEGYEPLRVKGLTLAHVTSLLKNYKDTLGTLISQDETTDINWRELLTEAPEFCQQVMCMALRATKAEEQEAVRELPLGIQIDVLIATWNMTSIDPKIVEAAAKKALALLSTISSNLGLTV